MKRAHVLVEGQTEEKFVQRVLRPHLWRHGVDLAPVLAATKRIKAGGAFRGGVTSYEKLRREVKRLLADTDAVVVTTMVDFYAFPVDLLDRPLVRGGSCFDRVRRLEEAFAGDIGDRRFLAYLSLHEFESLLLTRPESVAAACAVLEVPRELLAARAAVASPEEIDDGPETHPSARIARALPVYRKGLHGPIAAEDVGLEAMRAACPHFRGWIQRLEAL